MSNATATEPRAPESSVQPSTGKSAADPPEPTEVPDDPIRFMNGMTADTLARLKRMAPGEMDSIDNSMADQQCRLLDVISNDIGGDWTKTADVLEFAQNWTPAKNTEDPPNPELRTAIAKGIENIAPGLGEFLKEQHAGERIRTIATPDLSDIRERVRRIAGLIDAATIVESCFSSDGGKHDAAEVYFNAVSGTIGTAGSQLAELQKLLNGKSEGGAS